MLELHKECAEASREKRPRADDLKHKIDTVDNEIDEAVFRLYGLTDDEIKTVKEQTPHAPATKSSAPQRATSAPGKQPTIQYRLAGE